MPKAASANRQYTSESPLRIGILGAGRIAPKAIIEPLKSRADVVVTAIAARDLGRAKAFAAEHGIHGVESNYRDLIVRSDVDLVYVALPPTGHAEWSIAALRAGKAVLCEKPFAMNAGEAREMVLEAERSGRPLIEAFHYRFHPMLLRAFEVVASGKLGRVRKAEASLKTIIRNVPGEIAWDPNLGGGALMDVGCYPVHALRTILRGEPEVVRASARMLDGVDVGTEATLSFPGGVEARIDCSFDPQASEVDLTVEGADGRLVINNYVVPQRGARFRVTAPGLEVDERLNSPSTYDVQMAHVVDVMSGQKSPLTGGADAIGNMTALDEIQLAVRRQGALS